MQYNKSELMVPADCDEMKLTLEHVGGERFWPPHTRHRTGQPCL